MQRDNMESSRGYVISSLPRSPISLSASTGDGNSHGEGDFHPGRLDATGAWRAQDGAEEPWSEAYTGIKALMLAMLEDAIRCYLGPQGRIRTQAEQWIHDRREWVPFSFAVVCETLGLAPSAARTVLRRFHDDARSARQAVGRLRPNGRRPDATRCPACDHGLNQHAGLRRCSHCGIYVETAAPHKRASQTWTGEARAALRTVANQSRASRLPDVPPGPVSRPESSTLLPGQMVTAGGISRRRSPKRREEGFMQLPPRAA